MGAVSAEWVLVGVVVIMALAVCAELSSIGKDIKEIRNLIATAVQEKRENDRRDGGTGVRR